MENTEATQEVKRRLAIEIYKALASSSTCGRPLLLPMTEYDGSGEVVIDGYFDLTAMAEKILADWVY